MSDGMFLNGTPLLITMSSAIKFVIVENVPINMAVKLIKSLKGL